MLPCGRRRFLGRRCSHRPENRRRNSDLRLPRRSSPRTGRDPSGIRLHIRDVQAAVSVAVRQGVTTVSRDTTAPSLRAPPLKPDLGHVLLLTRALRLGHVADVRPPRPGKTRGCSSVGSDMHSWGGCDPNCARDRTSGGRESCSVRSDELNGAEADLQASSDTGRQPHAREHKAALRSLDGGLQTTRRAIGRQA